MECDGTVRGRDVSAAQAGIAGNWREKDGSEGESFLKIGRHVIHRREHAGPNAPILDSPANCFRDAMAGCFGAVPLEFEAIDHPLRRKTHSH